MALAKNKKSVSRRLLILLGVIICLEIVFATALLIKGNTVALLQPAGIVAQEQRNLLLFAAGLSLFVIVPVFVLLGFILWRYRDGNVTAAYRPNWDGSKRLEIIWWGLPCIIILVLAVVTYRTSHSLDPYRSLSSTQKPLRVQVVALEWKWLFIYPDYNIASVNHLQVPINRPINFEITSDAPMNSFWIPQLGGQVYAMSGMTTKLHLQADKAGTYNGVSSNISGEGFAGMKFTVTADSDEAFEAWHQKAHRAPQALTMDVYNKLSEPTKNEPISLYSDVDDNMFNKTVMKYMSPAHKPTTPEERN